MSRGMKLDKEYEMRPDQVEMGTKMVLVNSSYYQYVVKG